jgi:ABC-type Fe3+ transport system substrate-binding protein
MISHLFSTACLTIIAIPDLISQLNLNMEQTNKTAPNVVLRLLLLVSFFIVIFLPFILRPAKQHENISKEAADRPAKQLVIISPHWEGTKREFAKAFSDWTSKRFGHRTDIQWLDIGGTSDAARYVRSQFNKTPDGIDVDIFFGGGIDPYLQFNSDGLLQPAVISPEVLSRLPREYKGLELYDKNNLWFGTCLSGFGIIYNRKVLDILHLPEPSTWEDLGSEKFFTWVGSGDPRFSGSVHMAYEIMLQAYGWEKGWANIMKMCGNIRSFSRAGSDVPKDTALGEVACGLAIDIYAKRQEAEAGADRIGFVLPEGLTVINPDSIAILKGAPNAELASKFIEFVLSDEGQKLLTLKKGAPGGPVNFELGRTSVIPGFAARFGTNASATFDPFTWKGSFVYDAVKGSQRWTLLNDLIGAVIIDTHRELTGAWSKLKDADPSDPRLVLFLAPPFTEEECMRLATGEWKNPETRTRIRGGWSAEAKQRYIKITGR